MIFILRLPNGYSNQGSQDEDGRPRTMADVHENKNERSTQLKRFSTYSQNPYASYQLYVILPVRQTSVNLWTNRPFFPWNRLSMRSTVDRQLQICLSLELSMDKHSFYWFSSFSSNAIMQNHIGLYLLQDSFSLSLKILSSRDYL